MRKVQFNVAASLDGYIAGPSGEFDWIPEDPTVDFAEIFAGVNTVLLGRRSYEVARNGPHGPPECASTCSHGRYAPRTIRMSQWWQKMRERLLLRCDRKSAGTSGCSGVQISSAAFWRKVRWIPWRSRSFRSCLVEVYP